jgi:rubredoxin
MISVKAATTMDVSCDECRPLHADSWKHAWTIHLERLEMQHWKCRTCKLLYDGISALLGPAFVAVFGYIMFPERHEEDDGTLRVDIHPPKLSPIDFSVKVCRLRIYTAPGESRLAQTHSCPSCSVSDRKAVLEFPR